MITQKFTKLNKFSKSVKTCIFLSFFSIPLKVLTDTGQPSKLIFNTFTFFCNLKNVSNSLNNVDTGKDMAYNRNLCILSNLDIIEQPSLCAKQDHF